MPIMTVASRTEQWEALLGRMNYWFASPCLKTIRAAIATIAGLEMELAPVWLVVIAPPSTGKTMMYVSLGRASSHHFVTHNVLLSGLMSMEQGREGKGVLAGRIKGLWLVPELADFFTMKEGQQSSLFSTMRDLFDQDFSREARGKREVWQGRMNFLGGGTEIIDRMRLIMQEMGDRFITVRPQIARTQASRKKLDLQAGQEKRVREDIAASVRPLISGLAPVAMSDFYGARIAALADLAAVCRTPVEYNYNREIIEVAAPEGGMRLYSTFTALVKADAATHGLAEVGPEQFSLACEIAYDTMPKQRGRIMRLFTDPDLELPRSDIAQTYGRKWAGNLSYYLDALEAVCALSYRSDVNRGKVYRLHDDLQETVHRINSLEA